MIPNLHAPFTSRTRVPWRRILYDVYVPARHRLSFPRCRSSRLVTTTPVLVTTPERCGDADGHVPRSNESPPALPPQMSVKETLSRFEELRTACSAVNSLAGKRAIISRYPELRELLELMTTPKVRFNMRLDGLEKFLANNADSRHQRITSRTKDPPVAHSLPALLKDLAERRITGNVAKATVLRFLLEHGVMHDAADINTPEFTAFGRILERNLQAGVSAAVIDKVVWPKFKDSPGEEPAARRSVPAQSTDEFVKPGQDGRASSECGGSEAPATDVLPVRKGAQILKLGVFSCALGKAAKAPFTELFKGDRRWYVSRKLDGVRCITFLDFVLPTHGDPWLMDIGFYSRSGNAFTSLGNLATQLRRGLKGFSNLRNILERDPAVCNDRGMKRLVLDGEVCVMRPLTASETGTRSDMDHGIAGSLWEDDGLTEDFAATVSQVKRKYETVQYPAYFLFDVLSWSEFVTHGAINDCAVQRTFSRRQADVWALGTLLSHGGKRYRPLIRHVVQQEVSSRDDVDGMIERAAREGWEGLIMRADEPYRGKRSADILKIKQWRDSEYTVVARDTAVMRLAINGVYGEYEACANVWIQHRGHPVSVGSGFTAEQRLRYARDPSQIVGKQITVEYFGESESNEREGGLKSLRFPRVKHVWEDGRRDM